MNSQSTMAADNSAKRIICRLEKRLRTTRKYLAKQRGALESQKMRAARAEYRALELRDELKFLRDTVLMPLWGAECDVIKRIYSVIS